MDQLPAGYVLNGDYEITRALSADHLGYQYDAIDRNLRVPVIVKEFLQHGVATRASDLSVEPLSNPETFAWAKQRYLREAQALARFKHDAIWRVYRVLETNGTVYGIYEAVDGPTLQTWIHDLGRSPTQAEMDAILAPLLAGLIVIHDGGLIHRQIGPDSIRLRSSSNAPVLIDFSSAQHHRLRHVGGPSTHDPFTPIEMEPNEPSVDRPMDRHLSARRHFAFRDHRGTAGLALRRHDHRSPHDAGIESPGRSVPAELPQCHRPGTGSEPEEQATERGRVAVCTPSAAHRA